MAAVPKGSSPLFSSSAMYSCLIFFLLGEGFNLISFLASFLIWSRARFFLLLSGAKTYS